MNQAGVPVRIEAVYYCHGVVLAEAFDTVGEAVSRLAREMRADYAKVS